MKRVTAVAALPAAACAGEPQAPAEPAFPAYETSAVEWQCRCIERGECILLERSDERRDGQVRGYRCGWDDRALGTAICRYEARSRPAAGGGETAGPWSPWRETRVRFRRHRAGWCWFGHSDFPVS